MVLRSIYLFIYFAIYENQIYGPALYLIVGNMAPEEGTEALAKVGLAINVVIINMFLIIIIIIIVITVIIIMVIIIVIIMSRLKLSCLLLRLARDILQANRS